MSVVQNVSATVLMLGGFGIPCCLIPTDRRGIPVIVAIKLIDLCSNASFFAYCVIVTEFAEPCKVGDPHCSRSVSGIFRLHAS